MLRKILTGGCHKSKSICMPVNDSFRVRQMNLSDLSAAMVLSYSEGWNQTEKDWRLFLDDPLNICLVIEKGERIIGTLTALNYGNRVAWLGMLLIDKNFRRQGAGRLIFDQILKKVENFDSIKLDATPAGYPVYLKSGFVDERIIYRMTNTSYNNLSNKETGSEIGHITSETFSDVVKYDENIFGVNRTYLLKTLMLNYPEKAFALRRNNELRGYCLGREGVRFNYIGPVFAQSPDDARFLIMEALKSLNNKPVALDILEDKKEITEWLQSIGFAIQRNFIRMFLKSNKYCGVAKNQFLICGPEFG